MRSHQIPILLLSFLKFISSRSSLVCVSEFMSASNSVAAAFALTSLYAYGPTLESLPGFAWTRPAAVDISQDVRAEGGAVLDEKPDGEDAEEPDHGVESSTIVLVSPPTCPVAEPNFSFVQRKALEFAYSDESNLYWLGTYLTAAHAWCAWRCCTRRRAEEAEVRYRSARVVSDRASPSW